MSTLEIRSEDGTPSAPILTDPVQIAVALGEIGVGFERWETNATLPHDPGEGAVLAAFSEPIAALCARHGFKSVDVVRIHPTHPARESARQKFLAEHTHDDFEVRFFVAGRGRFYLHADHRVFMITCGSGDLLSVPAGMRHWFDMGENPAFVAIRLFTTTEGWVANFTGDDIATRFPALPT